VFDIRCLGYYIIHILLYYTYYILYYYYILLLLYIYYYYILYYTLLPLFFSFQSLLFPYLIYNPHLFHLLFFSPSQYSFYTCRYLHILIYTILISSDLFLLIYSPSYPTILISSDLISSSSLFSISSDLFNPIYLPSPIFKVYLSVLTYTYLYSRLIFKSDPARSIGVDG
jgi:hypothetical protein